MHLTASQLRDILLNEFTEAEVEALCEKLHIEYSRLSGTGVFGKTRELLALLQQQDRLSHLRAHMRAMRPHAFDAQHAAGGPHDDSREESEEFDGLLTAPGAGASRGTARGVAQDDETTHESDESDETRPVDSLEADDSEEDIVEPSTRRSRSPWRRGVARETSRAYEVVPQTRALVPLILVSAIIVVAALIVFLPSLLRGNGAASAETPLTTPAPAATPTSAIPVIAPPAPNTDAAAPAPVVPAAGDANSASGVVVLATPAPIGAGDAATPGANAIPTVPVLATPAAAAPQPGADHPAARLVQNANAALPAYYRGETGAEGVASYWTGKAYDITVSWNTALPRVLKLGRAARNTVQVDYEFVQPPTVSESAAGAYVVNTREYWAYRNPAANTNVCDTRDYTYQIRDVAGKLLIESVTSKIVDKTCR